MVPIGITSTALNSYSSKIIYSEMLHPREALCAYMVAQLHQLPCVQFHKSNFVADLWNWALAKRIILSAEDLPREWNIKADQASRVYHDLSKWKLDPLIFQAIMKFRPLSNRPISKSFHPNTQFPNFFSWKPA